jgi:hypothetical protein
MQRFMVTGPGLADDIWIWESARFCALATGATVAACDQEERFGFERAAEDPLRARE